MSQTPEALLSAYFPLESTGFAVSLQFVGLASPSQGTFRVVSWRIEGEKRTVDQIREQPVVFASGEPEPLRRQVLAHCATARIAMIALPESELAQRMPVELLGRPEAGTEASISALTSRFLRSTGALGTKARAADLPWDSAIEGTFGRLEIDEPHTTGDALRARMTVQTSAGARSEEVVLVEFPDEREPDRLRAYRAATLAVLSAVLDLVPSRHTTRVPLTDWVRPELLDDPKNTRLTDFCAALLAGPLGELLDHAVVEPTQARSPWVTAGLLFVMAVAGIGVADGLQHALGGAAASATVLVALLAHYATQDQRAGPLRQVASGSLVAMGGLALTAAILLAQHGPVAYSMGFDVTCVTVFVVGIVRASVPRLGDRS